MPSKDALTIAEDHGYDLVCVAPKMGIPVCKILDYGKYKFDQQKRNKLAKKHASKMQGLIFNSSQTL